MNEITQSKSLLSILEDIQSLVKEAASMELISRMKYSGQMRVAYWNLYFESSYPRGQGFVGDIEEWLEMLDEVISEKELLLEVRAKINYVVNNFAEFPDTFIDEDSENEPSPF